MRALVVYLVAGASVIAMACSASGAGGREVNITQVVGGCTPTVIDATPGEKLNLVVRNDSGKDYEIEGIDGAKLEEMIVPDGRKRSVGYGVPDSGGVSKIKCYIPGGVATIIEVRAGGSTDSGSERPGGQGEGEQSPAGGEPGATVNVALDEFTVEPDRASVPAGRVEFVAVNRGDEVHELYVLRFKDGAAFAVAGEIESIAPGESGSMTLDLPAGEYQLACLIVPGEAGSTADHYKEGMHTEFTVK